MFSQANKDIARYVDRGDYFRDSLAWYCKKFISPIPHWAYIFIITLFLAYGTYVISMLFFDDLKIKQYPLPISAIDQTKYFPHIKSLSDEKEPINVSIARYLTSSYVTAREKYNFADLTTEQGTFNRNFIKSISSARSSYEYDLFTSEDNPESPIVRYKSFITRNISIDNIELIGRWDLPEKAIILFTATEVSKEGDTNISNWKAELSFSMNDLETQKKQSGKSPDLRFTITTYNTKKLS